MGVNTSCFLMMKLQGEDRPRCVSARGSPILSVDIVWLPPPRHPRTRVAYETRFLREQS